MKLLKSRESLTLVAVLAAMFGLAVLVWTVWNNLPSVSLTAAANTRPARETRQAQTATAAAQNTITARQTRRARRTPTVNTVQNAETPSTQTTRTLPTFTRDPRTPTPDLGTPEIAGTAIAESPTPWPTSTSLPSLPQEKRIGFWVENLSFGDTVSFGENLNDPIGPVDWSPDGKYLAISQWDGDWINDEKGNPAWEVTWITLVSPDGKTAKPLVRGFMPRWSPDGKWIAYLAYEDRMLPLHIRMVNVETLQVTEIATLFGGLFPLPDWLSEHEIFYYDNQPLVFDTIDSATKALFDETQLAQFKSAVPLRYVTAQSELGLFALASQKDIYLFQRNGETKLIRHISDGINDQHWAISRDGELLVYTSAANRIIKIASITDEKRIIELPPSGRGDPIFQGWSPDEKSFLYRDVSGVWEINRDGSGRRLISEIAREPFPFSASWSPQGDQIIVNSMEGEFTAVPVTVK
ncbi:MAG: hypothetical protein B6D41_00545 [Chloroflexi bacterium UTCFX4]|jgi:Tol biopolymer transport system component|nr:MAG: hypothetical protein B6D41_00545 [Chloroflexi bacterium UTCFX4]